MLKRLAVTVMAACLALAVLAVPASAQDTPPFTKTVPLTGTNKGKDFKGTFTIERFTRSNGKLYAVGDLRGRLKGRNVKRNDVRIPASIASAPAGAQSAQQPPIPTPGACRVLNLVLGPINLNLLGLRVATNEIRLLIEAIPGNGNLLGNLLCAITNLLNPQAQTPLQQLVQVLNALLALVPQNASAARF